MNASSALASAPRDLDPSAVYRVLRRAANLAQPPWLHAEVARRMAERLTFIKREPQALLEWWGRLGAGSAELAQIYPHARRVIAEPTEALAEASRDALRAPWWTARHWRDRSANVVHTASALPTGQFGLIWANMMLHASPDPAALMARWQPALAPEGFVMFSCLGPGTLRKLEGLYQQVGWGPSQADLVDMHDLGDMLVSAGFADPVMDQEVLRLSWEDGPSLLAELRSLGANAHPRRFAGCRTPRWRDALLRELGALSGADGRIHMEFEIVYGHAFKAAPRLPVAAETKVSLETMRAMVHKRNPKQ